MKKYVCTVCGWVYDPAEGDPEGGIAPGTAIEDIPDDWVCPRCGVGKDDFEVQEDRSYLITGYHIKRRNFFCMIYQIARLIII